MENFKIKSAQDVYYDGETEQCETFDEDSQEVVELHSYTRLSKEEYIEREFEHWFNTMRNSGR